MSEDRAMAMTTLFADWQRALATASGAAKLELFHKAAHDIGLHIGDEIDKADAIDKLIEIATAHAGFGIGEQEIERIIADEFQRAEQRQDDEYGGLDPELCKFYDDRGKKRRDDGGGGAPKQAKAPPLALADWLKRDLPDPDLLLPWLSTTSRVLMTGPTGIGKTLLGVALSMRAAAGCGFLHWRSIRPARTLLIDGEMSRRLLLERLAAEAKRLGVTPKGMHVLSHEDIEGFAPLNTPQGQAQIERQIERIGKLDLITFDNVMCLIAGDQKDEEGWRNTLPWIRSLTRRSIGQIWLHHTGHDETRSYGTKTREWQVDTVIHMEDAKRPDTDVSFLLSFRKARERTPANRPAFDDCKVALLDNHWISDQTAVSVKAKVSPLGKKFYDALVNATTDSDAKKMFNCPAATIEEWRAECFKLGLIDKDNKPDSARTLFSKNKRELIAANWAACNETMAWMLN
jgi:hypothetical protein